jgi:hypothetical protein
MGLKKQAARGQGAAEMGEDCTASQGPQRTVALEKKKKNHLVAQSFIMN